MAIQHVFVIREAFVDVPEMVVEAATIQAVVDEFYPGAAIDGTKDGFTSTSGREFYCDRFSVVKL